MNKGLAFIGLICFLAVFCIAPASYAQVMTEYRNPETKDLVSLVRSASALVAANGEDAFNDFRKDGSWWKHDDTSVFVLDTDGNMLVSKDSDLEGKNQMGLKDVNGKPVIKNVIEKVGAGPAGSEGWIFYQWPEPGTIFSSWKSTFVKSVVAPSGKKYIVGSGSYEIKMEDAFLINAVDAAAALIEKEGKNAFNTIRDKSSQFVFLGTYIFVDTPQGIEVVNGGFPDIEGKNILDYKDPNGKYLTRDVIDTAVNKGSGWVDYMWPKPGETKPSAKHTYVKKAVYGNEVFAVGAGAYLEMEPAVAATPEAAEDLIGKLMVLELKNGNFAAGEILRETKDTIYVEHPDRTMEVSFPRNMIAKIRKPTDRELAKIKGSLTPSQEKK